MDRQYQTIDPMIMETLNLNENRIQHILDILHGRDPKPYHPPTARQHSQR